MVYYQYYMHRFFFNVSISFYAVFECRSDKQLCAIAVYQKGNSLSNVNSIEFLRIVPSPSSRKMAVFELPAG